MVELSNYNGIPHLMVPVVTEAKKAASVLNWSVQEMEKRYAKFAEHNVRNMETYNNKFPDDKMPAIVIIIDELADLMMVAPHDVEDAICRLAQKARAAGIHMVLATQRPSVDVITGIIKANIPSRISFAVSSQIDSRTILDRSGAEKLLGKGDMLFYPVGAAKPLRVQGAFISDDEVEHLLDFIRAQGQEMEANEEIITFTENAMKENEEKEEGKGAAHRSATSCCPMPSTSSCRRGRLGLFHPAPLPRRLHAGGPPDRRDGGTQHRRPEYGQQAARNPHEFRAGPGCTRRRSGILIRYPAVPALRDEFSGSFWELLEKHQSVVVY